MPNFKPHAEDCFVYRHARMLLGIDRTGMCTCGSFPEPPRPEVVKLNDAITEFLRHAKG